MPLDPYFAERLRVHRHYLIGQAWQRMLLPLRRWTGSAPPPPVASTGVKPTAKTRKPLTPRERHRRAALAWDRTELATVGTPGPEVTTEEHTVAVDGFPDVGVRIYRPHPVEEGPAPAVLAFFGGAFRIGGVDYPTTDAAYRRRAVDAGVIVVAVRYALAPEHRYPTQVEQGHAALEWLVANAASLGVDASRIGVQGTSAGGAIAAAVTLMNRDRTGHPLRLQLLEVPVVDLTPWHVDLRPTWAMGIPAIIALRELRSVRRTYLGDQSPTQPFASPLRAASHADLPPAVILTAEYDPLRRNGAAYGAALRRAGVDATVVEYRGVTHDAWYFTGVLDAARRWHDQAVRALRLLHD
ncbi:alpha/beta hydrolase [Microbacterium sp. bgisy189]|uniref:alpha/beta hydrolase n=1 Tax=Microbacterium sp. bgisy189 TaxID=3413798 RepID=UPI003EB82076